MSRMGHANTREEVIEAFRVFDKNGSGVIDANDLRNILAELVTAFFTFFLIFFKKKKLI